MIGDMNKLVGSAALVAILAGTAMGSFSPPALISEADFAERDPGAIEFRDEEDAFTEVFTETFTGITASEQAVFTLRIRTTPTTAPLADPADALISALTIRSGVNTVQFGDVVAFDILNLPNVIALQFTQDFEPDEQLIVRFGVNYTGERPNLEIFSSFGPLIPAPGAGLLAVAGFTAVRRRRAA